MLIYRFGIRSLGGSCQFDIQMRLEDDSVRSSSPPQGKTVGWRSVLKCTEPLADCSRSDTYEIPRSVRDGLLA